MTYFPDFKSHQFSPISYTITGPYSKFIGSENVTNLSHLISALNEHNQAKAREFLNLMKALGALKSFEVTIPSPHSEMSPPPSSEAKPVPALPPPPPEESKPVPTTPSIAKPPPSVAAKPVPTSPPPEPKPSQPIPTPHSATRPPPGAKPALPSPPPEVRVPHEAPTRGEQASENLPRNKPLSQPRISDQGRSSRLESTMMPPSSKLGGGNTLASSDGQKASSSSLSQPKGAVSDSATAPGKSGQLRQQIGDFSYEQTVRILRQVFQVSILLKGGSEGKSEAGSPRSILQTILLLQDFESLDQKIDQLSSQIQQAIDQEKTLPDFLVKEFNSALHSLEKQLDVVQKQSFGETSPFATKENGSLSESPLTAAAMLKAKSEQLLNRMQNQLQQNLEKTADQIKLLLNEGNKTPTASSSLGKTETPSSLGIQKPTPPTIEKAALSQKGQNGKITATSSISPSQTSDSKNVQMQAAREAKSPSESLPALVDSSKALRTLADGMLQKKETASPPYNIALIYPLDKQKEIATGAAKFDPNKEAGEQGKRWGICGGGCAQAMVLIPPGPVIVGEPIEQENEQRVRVVDLEAFLIAVDPVTNEQYADWLNQALLEKKIKLSKQGVILDSNERVLCKTVWCAPTSQIQALISEGQCIFTPIKGSEMHPVVQVSWNGAVAYCLDNGFRLPTEAEWEKAAGMPILAENDPLTRFLYGFGKNEIDATWANFREGLREYDDNHTTPVGFYNGKTVFTKDGKNYKSKNAVSPYGCYDMCGNVREWVSDGSEWERVTKGGSYNSPPSELVVSSRVLFDLHSCLPDTGFRVACDL
jgi:formylglycine-generating enzyme required for sulfatase activity